MLQSPHMLPVILYILQNRESEKDKDNSERMRGRQLWGLDRDNTTMTTVMKNTTANYIKGILESCWDNAELERKGICFEKCWICIFTNLDVMQNKSRHQTTSAAKTAFKISRGLHLVGKQSVTSQFINNDIYLFFWFGWMDRWTDRWTRWENKHIGQTHIGPVSQTGFRLSQD